MKIILIDNYDSFTYNLVETLRQIGQAEVDVVRNDHFEMEALEKYDAILLSPGPGLPAQAGKMPEVLRQYASTKPILGVCLGLQAMVEHFGGTLYNLPSVFHGVSSTMKVTDLHDPILGKLAPQFEAGRYHSWAAVRADLPAELVITAEDQTGEIMAIRHKSLPIFGMQYHPESILTPKGPEMLANFLQIIANHQPQPA
jgi:anthranilate synthase component 2